jgi:antitoxin (DNA-binding transcriptional repressor) of toxin-antitoxin stability system
VTAVSDALQPAWQLGYPGGDLAVNRTPPILTTCDYNMVMKSVRIAELKSRLSEHLRSVRKGRTLTVLDRDTPIARIVPLIAEPVEVRRATRRFRDLTLPPPPGSPTDSLAVLLDDRRRR